MAKTNAKKSRNSKSGFENERKKSKRSSGTWFWSFIVALIIIAGLVFYYPRALPFESAQTTGQVIEKQTQEMQEPEMQEIKVNTGFDLHIDAKRHFPGDNDMIAHHYCKAVSGGIWECQLYDSDAPDARLVGVEVVVPTAIWEEFSDEEKALWHYHKTEIPKVEATLPDLSPDEAAKVVKSLEETYGKIFILWDPTEQDMPIGQPSVTVLE